MRSRRNRGDADQQNRLSTRYRVRPRIRVAQAAPSHAPGSQPGQEADDDGPLRGDRRSGTAKSRDGMATSTTIRLIALLTMTACRATNPNSPISQRQPEFRAPEACTCPRPSTPTAAPATQPSHSGRLVAGLASSAWASVSSPVAVTVPRHPAGTGSRTRAAGTGAPSGHGGRCQRRENPRTSRNTREEPAGGARTRMDDIDKRTARTEVHVRQRARNRPPECVTAHAPRLAGRFPSVAPCRQAGVNVLVDGRGQRLEGCRCRSQRSSASVEVT